MKQFSITHKVTYNLMSYTGFKALLIFFMLTEGPKSFKEIREKIALHPYIHEQISIDTMRVYINSLKRIGCEVKRIKGSDKISKYVITSHPFELTITDSQKNSLLKIYKNIVKSMDIKSILYMNNFLEKIGNYIKDQNFIDTIINYSMMKDIDKNLLENLLDYCQNQRQIVIKYCSPNSKEKNIEIITKGIEILNNKIYLKGFGFEYNQDTIFPVSRIKEIIEVKDVANNISKIKKLKVQYEIKNCKFDLAENEKIITKDNNKIVIEASTTNKFLLTQRLLEFGPDCKIIKPNSYKAEFVELLNNMKAGYYCG